MRKPAKQIVILAAVLFFLCVLLRLTVCRTYTAYIPLNLQAEQAYASEDLRLEVEQPDILRVRRLEKQDGFFVVPIEPMQPGKTWIDIKTGDGTTIAMDSLHVDPFMTVYDTANGGFTGDNAVMIVITLFWLLTGFIMIWHFTHASGPSFYRYATIYYAGFSLFALVNFNVMLFVTVSHILHPSSYSMLYAYSAIEGAAMHFLYLTTPLIVLFALAMAVSNIALLKHERPRPQNALGLLTGVLMLVGTAVGWYLSNRPFAGSQSELHLFRATENVYAAAFVYFECMLAGSVICGLRAARYEPAADKDFIVILGCWFRRDGSLPPLLRGRADRAIAFWKKQKDTTGKEAFLISSGGQGRDECMPEAEAIRRYLIEQGIPEERILCEDKSRNTFENMAFSKAIAEKRNPGGKVVFATTNYHVFRSGVWAGLAGLPAEGIGSSTKWWFWPNAFMRECVGLLQNRWKQELLWMFLLAVFFGILSMILE